MTKTPFIFKEIPLDQIQRDPDQPRKDFGTEGDENRLLISIRDRGIQSPITVNETEPNNYIIADGQGVNLHY
jgi:ParB-like chromosome segregation protein Spo0J